jgi:hypothetical protein
LLDGRGEVVQSVPAAYVEQMGAELVNETGARPSRSWPPLRPGRSYFHCVLTGGPGGGVQHQYLDPDEDPAGPPLLLLVRGQVFRLAGHCGHESCPWHYAAAEHAG